MTMNDPLGDHAHPHPQRADAQEAEGVDAGLASCAQRVLDVLQTRATSAATPTVDHTTAAASSRSS